MNSHRKAVQGACRRSNWKCPITNGRVVDVVREQKVMSDKGGSPQQTLYREGNHTFNHPGFFPAKAQKWDIHFWSVDGSDC